jgi:O-antigen/teichoic acid export membrane protein
VWFIRREVEWRFAGDAARSVLRFGLPLVPAIMVTWANEQADRLILLWLSGLGGVAIYGAAAKTALIFHFAASMFRHAWRPYSMTLLEADDRNAIYRSVLRVYMAGFAIVGLAFTAAAPELFSLLVPQAYARGVACIPWLVGTALLYQSISITNLGLIVSRRTSEISRIAALAVLLNVAISIPLILAVGIEGAAIGAFIAVAALSALLLHGSNRAAGLAFQWRSLLGPTGVFLAGSLLTNELSQIEPLWSSALARITIVLFGSALIYRCFIDGDARSALASLVTVRTPAAS